MNPKWLPDGSGIDPDSIGGDTVVECTYGFRRARHAVGPIVRVYADVTPPKPDPRVEVVAKVLHDSGGCLDPFGTCVSTSDNYRQAARSALAALDAMGADQ